MDNKKQENKFVGKSCDSEFFGAPGACCGAKQEEKKGVGACIACSCPCDTHKEHNHK